LTCQLLSVCISEGSSAMIDNVVYEIRVSECVKIGYLQQQQNTKFPQSPRFAPHPHPKILGTPLLCPALKMKSRRLCICVSCHFVYILLGSFCDHCKNVWYNLFSGRPSKVLPWSWLKSLGPGLAKKVLFTSLLIAYSGFAQSVWFYH